jgi:TolA-binding protein
MLYLSARTYDLVGLVDSSSACYREVLLGPGPADVLGRARLGLALASTAESPWNPAGDALDSALPAVRDGLKDARRVFAARSLGAQGYGATGAGMLASVFSSPSPLACEAALLAADLVGHDDPEEALALLRAAHAGDIFEEHSLALGRARYACSAPEPSGCADAADKFTRGFPLDARSAAEVEIREALAALEGEGSPAVVARDGLSAAAGSHPLFAELLYRRGVALLVDGDYPGAKQAFGTIAAEHWDSDLYRDACFKMGSTYYLMERYDSSSIYFALAALSDRPALVKDALFNRGLALEEIGAFRLAAEVYRTLATRFPLSDQFERALVRRGYCLQSGGRPAEAIAVYKGLLQYADASETRAETMYWIGESLAAMGDHAQAACQFLRTAFRYPSEKAWAGTAAFMAGVECEKAGLSDHAVAVYRQNVRRFGKSSDWGKASQERLGEMAAQD